MSITKESIIDKLLKLHNKVNSNIDDYSKKFKEIQDK